MMGDTFRAIYNDLKAERDAQNREDEFVEWLNKAADEMSALNYFGRPQDAIDYIKTIDVHSHRSHDYCPKEGACYTRTGEFHGMPGVN